MTDTSSVLRPDAEWVDRAVAALTALVRASRRASLDIRCGAFRWAVSRARRGKARFAAHTFPRAPLKAGRWSPEARARRRALTDRAPRAPLAG